MSKRYPDILAFSVGLIIMGTELTATRFVAPYFGTSIFVWTNVIAVIMIALSIGYWKGGQLAGRGAPIRDLQLRLVLGSFALAAIPFVSAPFANLFLMDIFNLAPGAIAVVAGSFILVVALFFIPAFLLAMTSPFLVGYLARGGQDAGRSAGRIFAIGTMGSIIGTFLPAILLICVLC